MLQNVGSCIYMQNHLFIKHQNSSKSCKRRSVLLERAKILLSVDSLKENISLYKMYIFSALLIAGMVLENVLDLLTL